jgi:hypothetical protein
MGNSGFEKVTSHTRQDQSGKHGGYFYRHFFSGQKLLYQECCIGKWNMMLQNLIFQAKKCKIIVVSFPKCE